MANSIHIWLSFFTKYAPSGGYLLSPWGQKPESWAVFVPFLVVQLVPNSSPLPPSLCLCRLGSCFPGDTTCIYIKFRFVFRCELDVFSVSFSSSRHLHPPHPRVAGSCPASVQVFITSSSVSTFAHKAKRCYCYINFVSWSFVICFMAHSKGSVQQNKWTGKYFICMAFFRTDQVQREHNPNIGAGRKGF